METIMGGQNFIHIFTTQFPSVGLRFSINQSVIEVPDWAETFARPIQG